MDTVWTNYLEQQLAGERERVVCQALLDLRALRQQGQLKPFHHGVYRRICQDLPPAVAMNSENLAKEVAWREVSRLTRWSRLLSACQDRFFLVDSEGRESASFLASRACKRPERQGDDFLSQITSGNPSAVQQAGDISSRRSSTSSKTGKVTKKKPVKGKKKLPIKKSPKNPGKKTKADSEVGNRALRSRPQFLVETEPRFLP